MSESEQPTSTEVAARDEAVNPLALAETFSESEREAIAKFINVGKDDIAFMPFLGIAAHLGLSPLTGEIWLIKGRREEGGQWVDFYRPAVGRDGLLKYARRQQTFKGIRYGVVCANDTFEVEDDGWETTVHHRPASLNAATIEKGKESRYRGAVIGAWAKLYYRDGRPADYYFAPAHEHVKTKVKDGEREFMGAWGYTSAMLVKSAVSYVCRIGYGITGVVPFDELRMDDPQMSGESAAEHQTGDAPVNLGDDPAEANNEYVRGLEIHEDLKITLITAIDSVNELAPFTWTVSKLRLKLGPSTTDDDAKQVLAEVEAEFTALRDRAAEREAVEDAVEVVMARDLKAPIEVFTTVGEEEAEWVLVEDVVYDDEAGTIVLKLAGEREATFNPTVEVEARQPADAAGEA